MKSPDDIKKGLECGFCYECPYDNNEFETVEECARQVHKEALSYINKLESTISQVSKALCGKEKATLDEVLKAVDQLKNELEMARAEREDKIKNHIDFVTRLAQLERERDAALSEWKRTKMDSESMCWICKHALLIGSCRCRCVSPVPCDEGENWEWRGVCDENSKEDAGV